MNAHIINCKKENDFFNSFLPGGYLGVEIVITGTSPQKLSNACRTSYSMYADMKTIRPGDIIFVHTGQRIYGAFKAVTEFREDPSISQLFLSKNIHYRPKPNNASRGWKNNITTIPEIGHYRRMAIKHFTDEQGRNLCFENGADANEIFDLKMRSKIWSIPERWKYTDASRTVCPLMENEAFELLKIIDRENADKSTRMSVKPASLTNYIPIQFILDPEVVINEKIIEGWILENIGRNSNLDNALGPLTSFGNNMPAGYLKFMDIFGYQELITSIKKYKVIEVKKNDCVFPDDINQLFGYIDWVVENIAEGDYKVVEGVIIAKGFNNNCIAFINNFNARSRKIRLIEFGYVPPIYNHLNITRVV